MNKIETFLTKNVAYALWGVLAFSFFGTCNSMSAVRTANKALKIADSTAVQVARLQSQVSSQFYTKEELNIRMEIMGLETSKRTLYDWNAVIRTTVRPDDQMNSYDKQIQSLQNKLK